MGLLLLYLLQKNSPSSSSTREKDLKKKIKDFLTSHIPNKFTNPLFVLLKPYTTRIVAFVGEVYVWKK